MRTLAGRGVSVLCGREPLLGQPRTNPAAALLFSLRSRCCFGTNRKRCGPANHSVSQTASSVRVLCPEPALSAEAERARRGSRWARCDFDKTPFTYQPLARRTLCTVFSTRRVSTTTTRRRHHSIDAVASQWAQLAQSCGSRHTDRLFSIPSPRPLLYEGADSHTSQLHMVQDGWGA